MKKLGLIILILIILAASLLAIRFIFGGSEDDWICVNDQWVKHGVPSRPMPTSGCGDEEIDCQAYLPENCPDQCVVCPPCIEYSSISCQTEEFCESIGFEKDWYEKIQSQSNSVDCENNGGTWLEKFKECEYINEEWCDQKGGTFFECESACRHDPEAEICTMQCVPVCYLEKPWLDKIDLIQLYSPKPKQAIASPLKISGKARGTWFFEGDFPVILVDWDGRIIAESIAQAKSDWMTQDFVEFEATLEFEKPDTQVSNRGALILQKDNPSGLPQNDDALEIPIKF